MWKKAAAAAKDTTVETASPHTPEATPAKPPSADIIDRSAPQGKENPPTFEGGGALQSRRLYLGPSIKQTTEAGNKLVEAIRI
ncbi:MAG: hypothetical protein WC058_08840 [Phycisphaeraceae bacterium]